MNAGGYQANLRSFSDSSCYYEHHWFLSDQLGGFYPPICSHICSHASSATDLRQPFVPDLAQDPQEPPGEVVRRRRRRQPLLQEAPVVRHRVGQPVERPLEVDHAGELGPGQGRGEQGEGGEAGGVAVGGVARQLAEA